MRDIFRLLRVEHYLKNGLVFLPLFFNKSLLNINELVIVIIGFITFSLLSSTVYIFNDIQDVEKDKLHPKKKFRPIASGKINTKTAYILAFVSFIISLLFGIYCGGIFSVSYLIVYLALNIAYSLGLKDKPLIDIAILTSGFLIRLMYGAFITRINISVWLYLTVMVGAIYLGFGKRRNELNKSKVLGETREVLKYYNYEFLDKNMTIFMTLTIIFYSLWTVQNDNQLMLWSVPMVIFILLKYSLDIETNSDGDPVSVLISDKFLIGLVLVLLIFMSIVLYV